MLNKNHKKLSMVFKFQNQIPDVYETVLTMRRQRTYMVQKVENEALHCS